MATYQFLIANNSNGTIADISNLAEDPVVSPRMSDVSQSSFTLPLTPAVLALSAGDGYPLVFPGVRRLIVIRNGQCVANDIVWRIKPAGGPNSGYLNVECVGPMIRWQTRWCQDVGGQFFDGVSANGIDRGMDLPAGIVADQEMTVAPAVMLKEALNNTIAQYGGIGCTTTGTFDTTPASSWAGAAFAMRNLSPLRIADLATMFIQTGVLDITIAPTAGAGASQGSVSAVSRQGVDLPGVSFDYGTGANNIAWAYPEASMDEFANLLWYELEPRVDSNTFANNVTANPLIGVTTDSSGSQSVFGVYHDIVFKTGLTGLVGNTTDIFKMFVRLYNAELAARMVPRQIIRIVPQAGLAPEPWTNYNLGDTPRVNIAQLGMDVTGSLFRIIGWDARPENDGAERVELLIGWAVE